MIRIRMAQYALTPGDVRRNFAAAKQEILFAAEQYTDIIILPAYCLTGGDIGHRKRDASFLREYIRYREKLIELSSRITLIGSDLSADNDTRTDNALFVAQNGLPLSPFRRIPPHPIANVSAKNDADPSLYLFRPDCLRKTLSILLTSQREETLACQLSSHTFPFKSQADLAINISPAPFTLRGAHRRRLLLAKTAETISLPIMNSRRYGSDNNGKNIHVFDGMTSVYDERGTLLHEAAPFTAGKTAFLFDTVSRTLHGEPSRLPDGQDLLLPAMRCGVRSFLADTRINNVVIGLSGGIDSAVNAALYRSVLPADAVLLVNMPSPFTSETTKRLAAETARRLASPFLSVPIDDAISASVQSLEGLRFSSENGQEIVRITSLMKENMQARDRSGRILSLLAAARGGIFTCNANKTEMTIGYGTLYGDLAGAFAATADLWKHQIYALGRALNRHYAQSVIPDEVFAVKPSAELSETQNIEKGMGDPLIYEYHDYLFRSFVENDPPLTPEEILKLYMENRLEYAIGSPLCIRRIFPDSRSFVEDLEKWWTLFTGLSVAKRIQSPPLLAVSERPYGSDFPESQLSVSFTEAYDVLKHHVLSLP